MQSETWRSCSICKRSIPFSGRYYLCSVSTCQHKRSGFIFCSVECWDTHLGYVVHRTAHAEERKAPSKAEAAADETPTSVGKLNKQLSANKEHNKMSEQTEPRRIIVDQPNTPSPSGESSAKSAELSGLDTLVVVSKVKSLIREKSSMNTSQCAIDALTQLIGAECLRAIESAQSAGRKTVMGRDFGKADS
jgi:histone H3/H4